MIDHSYVISIDSHASVITAIIDEFVQEALNQTGYCALRHQVKLYQTQFEGTIYADAQSLGPAYTVDAMPMLEYFKNE